MNDKTIPRKSTIHNTQNAPLIARSWDDAIYLTGHKGDIPLKVGADQFNLSLYYLSHSIQPPAKLPIRYLPRFMKLFGPDIILRYLAEEFNYTVLPPVKRFTNLSSGVAYLTEAWLSLASKLQKHINKPNYSDELLDSCTDLIYIALAIKDSAMASKRRGKK